MFFPPDARAQAERVRDTFRSRRDAVARWLDIEPHGPVRIHLVEDLDGLRRIAGSGVPEWAIAVCLRDDVLVLRRDRVDRSPRTPLDLVLKHEVVHQVLNHLGGSPLPRWFEEGLCVYHAGVAYLEADTTLERLAAGDNLPHFAEADAALGRDARSAAAIYRLGESAVTRFLVRFGDESLRRLLRELAGGAPFDTAFFRATGETLGRFEREWRASVTPHVPWLIFVLAENIDLTLLFFGALLVAGGYLRWRLRRERSMAQLDEPGS